MARTGRPAAVVELSEAEREQLLCWSRRAKSAQALALRSRVVLACADGLSNNEVAEKLQVSTSMVTKWRTRFAARRLDGLVDEDRPGRPPSISVEQVEQVIVATLEQTPRNATHWSRASMASRTGLSRSTIGRIWRDFGLQPHRAETFKLSTDPLFVEKVVDVVGLYHNPPERAVVLCVDEKSQVQALNRSQPVLPMMPGMPERRTHDYVRNGITSLFAAFNIADGSVIGELHRQHRAARVQEVFDHHRQAGADRTGRAPDLRQLRNPQDPGDQSLARPTPTVSHALHPDRVLVDQPGRTLVRAADRAEDPPRLPRQRPGTGSRHPRLDRRLEQPPAPVPVDQDRRGNPRLPRTILSPNFRRRTLGPRSAARPRTRFSRGPPLATIRARVDDPTQPCHQRARSRPRKRQPRR